MADETIIDLSKRPCGTLSAGVWDGEPVNALLHAVFFRAGIEAGDHPIYPADGLPHSRKGSREICDRLPSPFPPPNTGPLDSVQDVLDCVEACKILNAIPPDDTPQSPAWDGDAGKWVHAIRNMPISMNPAPAAKPDKAEKEEAE